MANLGLIGSPQQINATAGAYWIDDVAAQNGAGWVFYVPTASGLTGGTLIAREISASGVPAGGEIDLAVPAAQSGYTIENASCAVLADGSFVVGYQELNNSGSWETDVVHYSTTGTVLDSFLVNTSAFASALANGDFQLSELGFGGTATPNAVLATYAENGTTPSSSTTGSTAAVGEAVTLGQQSTSAGTVGVQTVYAEETAGLTSSVDITLPGATTPLVFNAPAANSATTAYSVWTSNIVAASDGSFYLAMATDTTNTNSGATSAQINLYHVVSGSPQLLTTINESSSVAGKTPAIALLSNGDIAVEYSGALAAGGGFVGQEQQYVELFSPTGTQIGSTISVGVGFGGLDTLSDGNLATTVETSTGLFVEQLGLGGAAPGNFNGDGVSDLLLENTSGAVVVGEVRNGAETYTQVAGLGSEWSLKGNGDFLGNGQDQFLIENTSGAVDVGNVVNGQAQYTQVAALGPEWTFQGTGDFLGNGQDQFLIENTSGAVDVGNVVNGQAQYTQVAALGPDWSFEGTGDFLGDGKTGFLIENTSGAVDVGEVSGGTTTYTQIAGLGSEWKFEGTGDFLGNGQDQFLIENSSGAVDVGNVVNGQAQYTQVAALGPEWSFIGTGDYLGTGTAGFMIENTAGAVALGTISNGQASYTQVGALGSEWASHS